jgi:hypothetical protein
LRDDTLAARGETQEIESVPEESEQEEVVEDMLSHAYNLRTNLQVTFDLPADLSASEADRLAAFIKTLPIEE